MIIIEDIISTELPLNLHALKRMHLDSRIEVKTGTGEKTYSSAKDLLKTILPKEGRTFYNVQTSEEILLEQGKVTDTLGIVFRQYEELENEVVELSLTNKKVMLSLNKIRRMGFYERIIFLFTGKIRT